MINLELMLLVDEFSERFQREYIDKKTLYECIWEIWNVLDLIHPFPVCRVMDQLDDYISVIFRKSKNTRLCGMINKVTPPERSSIFINSNNPRITQLFSLYHEIMHWFFHSPNKTRYDIMGMGLQSIEDYHANEGAAEMMLPYRAFIPWLGHQLDRKHLDYEEIGWIKEFAAEEFNVSDAIVYYRLESLKYEIHQYVNGVDLHSLEFLSKKQMIARDIKVGSLNDQEWLLRMRYLA